MDGLEKPLKGGVQLGTDPAGILLAWDQDARRSVLPFRVKDAPKWANNEVASRPSPKDEDVRHPAFIGHGGDLSASVEHRDQLRGALQMKIASIGMLPTSVRLVSCISLLDGAQLTHRPPN
jgi:hypothetical protein